MPCTRFASRKLRIGAALLFFCLSTANAAPLPVLTFTQSTPGTVVATLTLTNNGCGGIGVPTSIIQSGSTFNIDSPIAVPPPGCVPGPTVAQVLTANLPPSGSLADGVYTVDWTAGGGIPQAQASFTIIGGVLSGLAAVPALEPHSLIVLAMLVLAGGLAGLARSRANGASAGP